jgi:hypothetical protein
MASPDYQVIFEDNGSLYDIYVKDANLNDWQKLVDFLRVGFYPTEFFVGDERQATLPDNAIDLLNDPEKTSRLIKVYVGDLTLHSHCFSEGEIEFDLAPQDVTNQAVADSVFLFMEKLSQYLRTPVRLTPENSRDVVLVEYNSEGAISTMWSS